MVGDNRTESDEARIDSETHRESDDDKNVTTDRETIRTWIEDSGAKPGYRTTDAGDREPYIYYPGEEDDENVEETDWDDFHRDFDDHELALVRHADRPKEGREQFELVDRTEAIERATLDDREVEQALMEGETVETQITETKVIEKTVQETETIESKVVDSEIVRDEIIDTELVRREIVGIHIGENEEGIAIVEDSESAGWEDDVQEIDVTEREIITLDVDETREVTRELIERKTVESRVVDHDVEETETVESDTLESRVDLEGVQRNVLESDLLGGRIETDEAIESGHVESEFTDEGTIETHLYERRIVEDEVVDRKRLTFELTDEALMDSETIDSKLVETMLIGSDATEEFAEGERIDAEGIRIDRDETTATATPESSTADAETAETTMGDETMGDETVVEDEAVTLDDDDVGKDVVDANDEKVGVVTEVDEDANRLYVDPNPGLAQRVKTRLGWEGHDDDAYSVEPDRISKIDDDYVHLRSM
ncbi:hypothetical protein [Halorussus lipolyticus]|uniref:hypothetical protein n=1 Tax=Halorussus lipolyticus TaxID=3034024 RepID=UPI0023E8322C|nr:hypothetical protein [Halorussus sp. DT80]